MIEMASPDPSPDRADACALSLAEQLDGEFAAMGERHVAQLAELAEIGMDLARAVKRRVAQVEAAREQAGDDAAGTGADQLGALGMSFNRITRAVRLTMTLEAHVRDARRSRLLGLEAVADARAQAAAEAEEKRKTRRIDFFGLQIEQTVKAAVLRRDGATLAEHEDGEVELEEGEEEEIMDAFLAAERLLKSHPAYRDFEARPKSAVLIDLCRDLKLDPPDWSLWADEDWAIEEAENLAGSPFAGLAP